jgi:glycosyltransferase involved in cell wall biosynthesis
LTGGFKTVLARIVLHYVRLWDTRPAAGVDLFIANSAYIARRIKKVYAREAVVVHPPVDVQDFSLWIEKEDFYFTASRMVPYKRVDLIVQAFAEMPERRLVVIGDGPEMAKIARLAGPNVTLLGYQPSAVLRDYMQRARAFVFAAEEDFGILPVEAQACGTPVIAFGKGGVLETVVGPDSGLSKAPTGLFFAEQTVTSLLKAIETFERTEIDPHDCRAWAEGFGGEVFKDGWRHSVYDYSVHTLA